MDYKIWKYGKGGSIRRLFLLSDIGFQLGGIAAIILLTMAMGCLEIFLQKSGLSEAALKLWQWVISLAIVAIPLIYFMLFFRMSKRVSAMQVTFAKDGEGYLYVFDYRSEVMQSYAASCGLAQRQYISGNALYVAIAKWKNSRNMSKFIDIIDKNKMIEGLLEQKRIFTYGRRIVLVKLIEEKGSFCRLYCVLEDREGRKNHKELVLSKSYDDYEGLIREFRKLEDPLNKDSIRYCPFCGSMLVRDFCPKCQPSALPVNATKGDKWRMWDPKLKILNIVLYIITIASLICCIAVRIYSETQVEYSYEEVTAIVLECTESHYRNSTVPDVTVTYKGQRYRLINVKSGGPIYMVGFTTQAYLSEGKMYANIDGIKSKSIWGRIYFFFLGSTCILGFAAIMLSATRKDMKMKE